jgi:hypothetical protein
VNDTDIIDAIRTKLAMPVGRHLYGVLANYSALTSFSYKLQQAKDPDGKSFPKPLSVNRGILDSIPDPEFRKLVLDEARRPEPTAAHVAQAFERFLRSKLKAKGLLVLANFEMMFAYHLELNLLRTMAADDYRVLLLLPGKRVRGRVVMFPDLDQGSYMLPTNLIAENHLWEIKN